MLASRRHRLIWIAVGGAHLAALGAVWFGGLAGVSAPVREGGLVMVSLLADPVALPGEAKGGVALGAGLPVPVAARVTAIAPAALDVAAKLPSAAVPATAPAAEAPGDALAALPSPAAEVFVPPAFRFRQEPAYPERARRAGVEGTAGVRIMLSADGSVRAVELTRSSGSRLLDEAALAAARASTFAPATRSRVSVASEAVASYRFELR